MGLIVWLVIGDSAGGVGLTLVVNPDDMTEDGLRVNPAVRPGAVI